MKDKYTIPAATLCCMLTSCTQAKEQETAEEQTVLYTGLRWLSKINDIPLSLDPNTDSYGVYGVYFTSAVQELTLLSLLDNGQGSLMMTYSFSAEMMIDSASVVAYSVAEQEERGFSYNCASSCTIQLAESALDCMLQDEVLSCIHLEGEDINIHEDVMEEGMTVEFSVLPSTFEPVEDTLYYADIPQIENDGACYDIELDSQQGYALSWGSAHDSTDNFSIDCPFPEGESHNLDLIDVSFTWTAPRSGCYIFSSLGSFGIFDAAIQIRDVCGEQTLACDWYDGEVSSYLDSSKMADPRLEYAVEEGETYTIILDMDFMEEDFALYNMSIIEKSEIVNATEYLEADSPMVGTFANAETSVLTVCGLMSGVQKWLWTAPSEGIFDFEASAGALIRLTPLSCGEQSQCSVDWEGTHSTSIQTQEGMTWMIELGRGSQSSTDQFTFVFP